MSDTKNYERESKEKQNQILKIKQQSVPLDKENLELQNKEKELESMKINLLMQKKNDGNLGGFFGGTM